MPRVAKIIRALFLVFATGCEAPTTAIDPSPDAAGPGDALAMDSAPPDAGPEADAAADAALPPRTTVRYDLAAAAEGDFFAFPYPSDRRLNGHGAPDLTGFPMAPFASELLPSGIAMVEAHNRGFSPMSAVYFSFTGALNPDSLPQSAAETAGSDATAYLLDVDPASPGYGGRSPARITYNAEGGGHWPPSTLAVRPLYGVPLNPGTTYAAVVTDGVRTADDQVVSRPPGFGPWPAAGGDPETMAALAPLAAALADAQVDPQTVVAASVFTTADPFQELVRLTTWMTGALPVPTPSQWTREGGNDNYTVYEGRFDAEEFFSGAPPYSTFGDGRMVVGEDGTPADRRALSLRFALSVPTGAPPESGWPVVLYAHGLGEDYRGFVRVAANALATRGVAAIGINPPLQGQRNPTDLDDRSLVIQLSISNIIAGREILRQGVCDTLHLLRMVQSGITVPAEVSLSGDDVHLDPGRVGFIGHSEGGQVGALFMALDHRVRLGAISAGGAGAAITLLDLQLPEFDVRTAVSLALGVDETVESFDLEHPIINAVIQPLLDVADPLHAARRIYRTPGAAGPASVIMTEGFEDPLTPPRSIETLGSVIGLPIAEPVGREVEGLVLQGIDSIALPAHGNLESDEGDAATGALLQYPEGGHYLIYQSRKARRQIFDFMSTGLVDGRPEVVPPPE